MGARRVKGPRVASAARALARGDKLHGTISNRPRAGRGRRIAAAPSETTRSPLRGIGGRGTRSRLGVRAV